MKKKEQKIRNVLNLYKKKNLVSFWFSGLLYTVANNQISSLLSLQELPTSLACARKI